MTAEKKRKGTSNLPAYAVILAGGHGTRFWPVSRRARPKQFLPLAPPVPHREGPATGQDSPKTEPGSALSLLQQTYRRLVHLFPPDRIFVVGAEEHKKILKEDLSELRPAQLLLEPQGRNTAAALALVARHVRHGLEKDEADALLAVFPADHVIENETSFRSKVRSALQAASDENVMVVLGIQPTQPYTGYGYIESGFTLNRLKTEPVFAVRRFTEKPDADTARRYLRTKRYFWNAGMFFWRLSFFDAALEEHLPGTHRALGKLSASIGKLGYAKRLKKIYAELEDISVDYALAEPLAASGQARLLVADIGWSDLGTWSAIYDWFAGNGAPGDAANLIPKDSFMLDATGNLIRAEGKFVAAIGIENLIVVETVDALLICPRDRAQDVGEVVKHLRQKHQEKLL